VAVGDTTVAGQPLADLNVSDLDAEEARLRTDLERARMQAEDERRAVRADNARVRWEHGRQLAQARDLEAQVRVAQAEARAQKDAQSGACAVLDAEIARLRPAITGGLGDPAALADIQRRRETAVGIAAGSDRILVDLAERAARAEAARIAIERTDVATLFKPEIAESQARIDELTALIAAVEQRRRDRAVLAPCAGIVTAVLLRAGDTVPELGPVAMVQETSIPVLDAWLPEGAGPAPLTGQQVQVVPVGTYGVAGNGTVSMVHPGFAPMPLGLLPGTAPVQGRKVRIVLCLPHGLVPGQRVEVELLDAQKEPAPVVVQGMAVP
jgi:multidrug resistance efflux pump